MATFITEECINCGACEPECPNTAIYQGAVEWDGLDGQKHPALSASIFYIVPDKCTECVGFYDHEACAAVCPVDCCIPDPQRPESEAALLERARQLHPEKEFGADFPSRFRKDGAEAPSAAPSAVKPADAPAARPAAPAPAAAPASDGLAMSIPSLEEWEVPIACFRCGGEYTVPFRYFRPGVVFYCPHCTGSFVPNSEIYDRLSRSLRAFYGSWTKSFEEFRDKRARELEAFEQKQRALLEEFESGLKTASREATPAGAPPKRRSVFG
jgi:ferredoxin